MTSIAFYAPMKSPDHSSPSGDRRMGRLLIRALKNDGHKVEVMSPFRSYDKNGDASYQRRIASSGRKIADRIIRRLNARPASERPGLWFTYHLYHKAPDWLGPRVSKALNIPYVVAEASHAPKQADGPWAIGYEAARSAIKDADCIIGFNHQDAGCVLPLLADERRWVSMAPFIDTAPYQNAAANRAGNRRALCHKYNIADEGLLLLAVAMMRPGDKLNSYKVLAAALSKITDPKWTLLIAGDGEARTQVERAFATLKGRVVWLGQCSENDLPALYSASDLYVWPAVNEAFGMAFLEAQAAGLPVVAGRCGGVPDVVEDGCTGLLSAVGDAAAFAASVATLIDDKGLRTAMGKAALEKTRTIHDLAGATAFLSQLVLKLTLEEKQT